MPQKTVPDEEIRRLYRLPPEEFTAARNALAKELRKEKKAEAAQEVQALAKPSPSAWAVNALFEREPQKMEELAAAGRHARAAQGEAVSGRGAAALKEALQTARRLSDDLRWEAGRILAERGRPPSREVLERISASLQALAFSPAAEEAAARGWLEDDLEPPGFEVLAGLAVSSAPVVDLEARRQARQKEAEKAPEPERPAGKEKKEKKDAEQEKEEARRRQEAAEAARREREAEERRRRIAAAKEKVASLREEADSLGKEAERAEREAADARQRAETAERAAARAREKAETVARRLELAREQLREAEAG